MYWLPSIFVYLHGVKAVPAEIASWRQLYRKLFPKALHMTVQMEKES